MMKKSGESSKNEVENDFIGIFIEEGVTKIEPLYRGTSSKPDVKFKEGFTAKGKNSNLMQHVLWQFDDSRYISTSSSKDITKHFAAHKLNKLGYIYEINPIQSAINVEPHLHNEFVDGKIKKVFYDSFSVEREFSVPDRIKNTDIKGAWEVEYFEFRGHKEYFLSDNFIPNPDYKPNMAVRLAQGARYLGRGLTITGAAVDSYNLVKAAETSVEIGSFKPFFAESARVISGWSGAAAIGVPLAKAGATIGSAAGPIGTVVGGFTLGAIGSIIGYTGASQMVNKSLRQDGVANPEKFVLKTENQKVEELWGKTADRIEKIISAQDAELMSMKRTVDSTHFLVDFGIDLNISHHHLTRQKLNLIIDEQNKFFTETRKIYRESRAEINAARQERIEAKEREEKIQLYRGLEQGCKAIEAWGNQTGNQTIAKIGSVGASSVSIAFNVAALTGAIPGVAFTGWGLAIPYAGIALGVFSIASALFGKRKKKDDPTLKALQAISEQIESLRRELHELIQKLSEDMRQEFLRHDSLVIKLNTLIKVMIGDGFESLDFKMSDLQHEIDRLNSLVTHGLQAGYLKDLIEAVDKILLYVNVNGERALEIEAHNLSLVVWMTNPNIIKNTNGLWPLQACSTSEGALASTNLRHHDNFLKTDAVHQLGYLAGLSKQILPAEFETIDPESIPNLSLFIETLEAYTKARIHMGVRAAQDMDKNNRSFNKIKGVVENAQKWMGTLADKRVPFMNLMKMAYAEKNREFQEQLLDAAKNRLINEKIKGFASQEFVQMNPLTPWPLVVKHIEDKGPDLSFTPVLAALLDPQNDPNKTFLLNAMIESALKVGAGRIEAVYKYMDIPAVGHCRDLGRWNFDMWVNTRGVTYDLTINYHLEGRVIKLFDLQMTLGQIQAQAYAANFKKNEGTLNNASNHRQQVARNQNNIPIEQHLIDSWTQAKFSHYKDSHREIFSDRNKAQGDPVKQSIVNTVAQRVIAGSNTYPEVRKQIIQAIREQEPLLGVTPRDLESIKTLMIHYAKLLNLTCLKDLENLWGKNDLFLKMNRYKDLNVLIEQLNFEGIGNLTPIQQHFNYAHALLEYLETHETTAKQMLQQQEAEAQIRRDQVRNDSRIDPALVLDPQTIDESELKPENSLGSGTFGQVYHITQGQTNHLAVKVFHKGMNPDKSARTEIEVATRLSRAQEHSEFLIKIKGLTKLLTFGTAIVMEYANGGNLYDALHENEETLPWEPCVRICNEMALGIKFLHDHQIIHRDLKSTNILLTEQYRVKISDYGLARVIGASQSMASHRHRSSVESLNLIGTPAYRSPEQCNHPGRMADQKSDVYALSLIMWEILTRRIPFDHTDGGIYTIMNYWSAYKHLDGDNPVFKIEAAPEDATEIVKNTFTQVRELINQGLRMKPENRPSIEVVVEKTCPRPV